MIYCSALEFDDGCEVSSHTPLLFARLSLICVCWEQHVLQIQHEATMVAVLAPAVRKEILFSLLFYTCGEVGFSHCSDLLSLKRPNTPDTLCSQFQFLL